MMGPFHVRWTALLCALAMLPAGYSQESRKLKIVALEGAGGFNDMVFGVAHDLMVEVRNEQGEPVKGAKVVFSAPANGPSVLFPDGSRLYITTADELGRAAARGLKPVGAEGRFAIQVTASAAGQVGSATIAQSNTLATSNPPPKKHKSKAWIALVIAGAAAGVAVGVSQSGGSSPEHVPSPTILTVGSVSVGGPR